jgi:hypothetical protein
MVNVKLGLPKVYYFHLMLMDQCVFDGRFCMNPCRIKERNLSILLLD